MTKVDEPYKPPVPDAVPEATPRIGGSLLPLALQAEVSLFFYGLAILIALANQAYRMKVFMPSLQAKNPQLHDTYYSVGPGPLDWPMLISALAGAVLFLNWKYRAAFNARFLKPELMTVSPVMAVASYFIPLVNLVTPCRAMAGIARASGIWIGWVALWWIGHLGNFLMALAIVRPLGFELFALLWALVTFLVSWQLMMSITRAQTPTEA
ncbi:DUF4328 domain-containing protein [Haloferula sp. BvORR071]|uniref:DUF4328 domain-containing protein n=1 Tax=Haloferula sp. BvORR071 TaxID=1396141 RepID=UPI00054ED63C|nr:DUF4328 domain-containing protein [Haloferula sp. BvORR071]